MQRNSQQITKQQGGAVMALLVLAAVLTLMLLMRLPLTAAAPGVAVEAGLPGMSLDPLSQREQALAAKLVQLLTPFLLPEDFRLVVHEQAPLAPPPVSLAGAEAQGDAPDAQPSPAQPPLQVVLLINRPTLDADFETLLRQLLLPALGLSPAQTGALKIVAHPFAASNLPGAGSTAVGGIDVGQWSARLGRGLGELVAQLLPWLPVLLALSLAAVLLGLAVVLVGRLRGGPQTSATGLASLGELQRISREEPRRIANVLSQWMEQDER